VPFEERDENYSLSVARTELVSLAKAPKSLLIRRRFNNREGNNKGRLLSERRGESTTS
jgi:hypothetical protein